MTIPCTISECPHVSWPGGPLFPTRGSWCRSWFECKTHNKANQTTRHHMINVHSSSESMPGPGCGSIKGPRSQRGFFSSASCQPTTSHRSPNTTPRRAYTHSPSQNLTHPPHSSCWVIIRNRVYDVTDFLFVSLCLCLPRSHLTPSRITPEGLK